MIRNIAFIVVGLLVAGGVFYGIYTYLPMIIPEAKPPEAPVQASVSTIRVMVANNPLPKGRQVNAQDFTFMDFPAQKDANGNLVVPGWISRDVPSVTDEETDKQSLSGQYAQFDIMPFTPLSRQQFGPVKPAEPQMTMVQDTATAETPVAPDDPQPGQTSSSPLLQDNVVEFPLIEAGTLSSAGDTIVDVVLVRKADLVSGGEWTVAEPILRNVKLQRIEGENAGPTGVTFYAELDKEDDVTKVKLARAIGTVRLEPSNPTFRPRGSQICIEDRCYQPEAAPEAKTLTDGQPVPGFNGFGGQMPGMGPDGMIPNMTPGGMPSDMQLQQLTPGGAAVPPGTAQPMGQFQGGATFAPGQPSNFNNQPPGFNPTGLNGQAQGAGGSL